MVYWRGGRKLKSVYKVEKRYTIEQLRSAWGAGKAASGDTQGIITIELVYPVPMTLRALEDLRCIVTNYWAYRKSLGEDREDLYSVRSSLLSWIEAIRNGKVNPCDYPPRNRA